MRIIVHLDMDAFFAAVEERHQPDLRGRPIVIGADPKGGTGRGVVSTASYAARRYGIRSAMPISRAWRLAEAARARGEPETIFLRGNYPLYREVSRRLMEIIARGADAFEEASIDEAYLDVSSLGEFERAAHHARALKSEILEREGLTCSVGVGPNKLIAKIASDPGDPGHRPEDGAVPPRPGHSIHRRAPGRGGRSARGMVREVGSGAVSASVRHLREPGDERVGKALRQGQRRGPGCRPLLLAPASCL